MQLANGFIFRYVESLYQLINDENLKFPAQVNYVIQKNFKNLYAIYEELDKERTNICKEYSTGETEEGMLLFEDDVKRLEAEKILNELMAISQEVNIIKFKIESLGDTPLTSRQMEVLMFMIDEGQE